jgi:acyl-coenzyme A synthetase/AMP-(fatty) acid ligase
MWRIFPVKNNEVFLQRSSLNFAISIWEIFGALLKGAKVLITNNELFSNSQLLIKIFRNRGVTRIVVTPTVLKLLLQTKNFNEISLPKLNHLSICGEIFYCKLYNDLRSRFKKAKIIHQYGTTETHDALFYITDKKRIHTDKVPLKYPVDNLSIYILDDKLKACPIGTPGKLYISGPSLARGYYLNCRLTSQSFLPNPYNPLERMYSTNDIVSKDKHGYIYYIGRSDNQIKFNGIRIELESIEYRIKEFKNIRNAVVLYHEENNAFFLTSFIEVNNNFRLPQLRSYLEKSLPHNIFISDFIITKSLPKNKNGKLDRHGLIKLINTKNSIKEEFRNENSNSSINIWREIFNRKEVKKDDNFFKLGGNSLHALMICNKIASRYKIKIKMEAIFAFPSPWLLAQKFNLPF